MTKQILPNRWFIWTIVAIIVAGASVWGYIQYAVIQDNVTENISVIPAAKTAKLENNANLTTGNRSFIETSPSLQTITARTLSPNEITEWKIYEDTSFGFRLKYPANFLINTPYNRSSLTPPEQLLWSIGIPEAIQSSENNLGWLDWSVHNLLEDSKTREWVAARFKNPESTIMQFGANQMIEPPETGGMYRSFNFILLDQSRNKAVSFDYTGTEERDKIFYTILSTFELFTPTTSLKIDTRSVCEVNRKLPNNQVAAEKLKSACASVISQDTCKQTDVYESETETFGISDGFPDCVWHTYYDYSRRH